MTKILVLCTGNSCRSQMAEAFLKSFDSSLDVHSAGTFPAKKVHPKSVQVMKEIGLDISKNSPKLVGDFLQDEFDYVITVCDDARQTCPAFLGKVKHRLHYGFEDPADAEGGDEEVLAKFREIRDKIKIKFSEFYQNIEGKQ